MKESIRCCISCILPCGALDVIRIVHISGRVEEIAHSVSARDIMQAYPKHVLRKPPSFHHDHEEARAPRTVILPPTAELQRGKIYFLMPINSSSSSNHTTAVSTNSKKSNGKNNDGNNKSRRKHDHHHRSSSSGGDHVVIGHHDHLNQSPISIMMNEEEDRYLSEILSEKVSTQRERRRGRVGVWRPHLESISETITNEF